MRIIAVVRFSRSDDIRKVKLDVPRNLTVGVFSSLLQQNLQDVSIERIEYYNEDKGTFLEKNDMLEELETAVSRIYSVLVVESASSIGQQQLLRIEGRAFDITASGLEINGRLLHITERNNRSEGTGLNTWDGSVVLAKFLEIHPELVSDKLVLEVGAGTGVAGLAAHIIGSRLAVLTDLEYVIDNLQANVDTVLAGTDIPATSEHSIASNPMQALFVKPLDWGDEYTYLYPNMRRDERGYDVCINSVDIMEESETSGSLKGHDRSETNGNADSESGRIRHGSWDVIIGADVVWLDELAPLLATCLGKMASKNTLVLLAHQTRSRRTDDIFFSHLRLYFDLVEVDNAELHPNFTSQKIRILQCRKKFMSE